jgi:hypothetical protein
MGADGEEVLMRVALTLVASLAAILALASCGDTVSLNPVAKAAERTEGLGGMRISTFGTVQAAGEEVRYSGSGIFDTDTNSGRLTVNTRTGDGAQERSVEIVEGTVVYIRSPSLERALPSGKHWVKVDVKKLASKVGVNLDQITVSSSPLTTLEQLRKSSKSIMRAGRDEIRGVSAAHYRVVVDPSKALPRKFIDEFDPRYKPVDVWVDAERRVRRMTMSLSVATDANERGQMDMGMELYSFGVHADVQPPPDDQVIDLEDVNGLS